MFPDSVHMIEADTNDAWIPAFCNKGIKKFETYLNTIAKMDAIDAANEEN